MGKPRISTTVGLVVITAGCLSLGACSGSGSGASGGGHGGAGPDGGGSLLSPGGGAGTSGIVGPACATSTQKGEAIPLDMYVLLDKSGSMNELTGAGTAKWSAIVQALETFVKDAGSGGLGVGLQYFPLYKPGAPHVCTSHADCGSSGPCFLTVCGNATDVTICASDTDCPGGGPPGVCTPFGVCEFLDPLGTAVLCNPVGSACSGGPSGLDLGQCIDVPDRWCVNGIECAPEPYATPDVPIVTLPDGAEQLLDSIRGALPGGNTPTGPALEGAIAHARDWGAQHPVHRVIAVLATDGLPTECDPQQISQVARIATRGINGTPSVATFVIGVFGPDDVESPRNLDTIALAGGSGPAFIVDTSGDVTKNFLAALDSIRGAAALPCELQLPKPDTGGGLDYAKVNLELTDAAGKTRTLGYVTSASGCAGAPDDGWYYDADPAQGAPTKIHVCPDVCGLFKAQSGATVSYQIGCDTMLR